MNDSSPFDWNSENDARNEDSNTGDRRAVDWAAKEAHLKNDRDLIHVIDTMFLDCVERQTDRLQHAMDSGESLAIRLAAHTLKGSIGQVFAMQAEAMIIDIEARALAGQVAELVPKVARFFAVVDTVRSDIVAYQDAHPQATT